MRALVLDIGGTFTRAGIYDLASGQLTRSLRGRTPGGTDRARLYDLVVALSLELDLPHPEVLSVAFAGPVDPVGVALQAPTIWGAGGAEPVRARLAQRFPGARIRVMNDLTAAGLCFRRQAHEDLCVVTVSSGIGHKLFLGGRPILGPRGRGGELGHVRVDFGPEAPRCDCGGVGHLGAVASGRASRWQAVLQQRAAPAAWARSALAGPPEALDNEVLAAAFRAGDPVAGQLVFRLAAPLGQALAALHAAVGVERFVIMGGFAHALGDRYLALLAEAADASVWEPGGQRAWTFEAGVAGDEAGLIGAGRAVSEPWFEEEAA